MLDYATQHISHNWISVNVRSKAQIKSKIHCTYSREREREREREILLLLICYFKYSKIFWKSHLSRILSNSCSLSQIPANYISKKEYTCILNNPLWLGMGHDFRVSIMTQWRERELFSIRDPNIYLLIHACSLDVTDVEWSEEIGS